MTKIVAFLHVVWLSDRSSFILDEIVR